ncbi:MAG: hypothetical protein HC892_19280 [Saprospiraceae bacterium]|nr:hypothetical protein [Saprospiraceae bacterium]
MKTQLMELMEQLTLIREQLRELKAVKCAMYHEKMKLDVASNLFVSNANPDALFERTGFCSLAIRKQRLACAHTSARYLLRAALSLLNVQDTQNTSLYHTWEQELNRLEDTIHSTDHQKGDLEKEYAILWNNGQVEEAQNLTLQIAALEKIHSNCVEQIDQLRYNILHQIEDVILNQGFTK